MFGFSFSLRGKIYLATMLRPVRWAHLFSSLCSFSVEIERGGKHRACSRSINNLGIGDRQVFGTKQKKENKQEKLDEVEILVQIR